MRLCTCKLEEPVPSRGSCLAASARTGGTPPAGAGQDGEESAEETERSSQGRRRQGMDLFWKLQEETQWLPLLACVCTHDGCQVLCPCL